MKLILLTHEREYERVTNTGVLVSRRYPELSSRVLWQRKQPNAHLIELIDAGRVGLLYPSSDANVIQVPAFAEGDNDGLALASVVSGGQESALPEVMILLDATWQEAAKMYRQSAYLQALPAFVLEHEMQSAYVRRRNQKAGGLCTLECAAALLTCAGELDKAQCLLEDLEAHNQRQFDTYV
ncbi:tRNA-uridine aminocarboxypropyltransferase [Shewanella sp. GXUN23E]|uniref:tRNA-uridine aminocarboxypropyltransferase n=1 Tax=Shewanella sp. GXUN23E TaxID=3422498 RepID=UPI003D7CCB2F